MFNRLLDFFVDVVTLRGREESLQAREDYLREREDMLPYRMNISRAHDIANILAERFDCDSSNLEELANTVNALIHLKVYDQLMAYMQIRRAHLEKCGEQQGNPLPSSMPN